MLIKQITPAIFQEALRRTPNHKAAGPDGTPSLVLKHMPPAFHEALHLLFQTIAITGITPPPLGSRAAPFSYTRRENDEVGQLPLNHPSHRPLQALDYVYSHTCYGLY
jgi:hypothetical protein